MKLKLKFKGREFEIEAEKASKAIGLMFSSRERNSLVFDFLDDEIRSIHSFFVFFPFLAIWFNKEGKVVGKKIVRPFRFSVIPEKPFSRLIEIPVSSKNSEMVNFLVEKE